MYQGVVQLKSDNLIYADPQVWKAVPGQATGTVLWGCFSQGTCPNLGGLANIDYAYQTFYWNSARTQVNFYTETHDNLGFVYYVTSTYTKGTSDTSNVFSAGEVDVPAHSGIPEFYAKMLQFGLESHVNELGFQMKQYGMGYQTESGSSVSLDSQSIYDNNGYTDTYTAGGNGPNKGSDLTWYYDSSVKKPSWIGGSPYNAQAYFHHSDSWVPSGTVIWIPGSPPVAAGSQLWP